MSHLDSFSHALASPLLYWPACVVGVCLIAMAVLGPEAERRLALQEQVAAMQAEVDALTRTRDQLAAAEKALRDDPAYTERVVRHELGITRPGEMRLPQPVALQASAPAAPKPAAAALPPPYLAELASFGDERTRFLQLVGGAALLGVAIILSLPGRPAERGAA